MRGKCLLFSSNLWVWSMIMINVCHNSTTHVCNEKRRSKGTAYLIMSNKQTNRCFSKWFSIKTNISSFSVYWVISNSRLWPEIIGSLFPHVIQNFNEFVIINGLIVVLESLIKLYYVCTHTNCSLRCT